MKVTAKQFFKYTLLPGFRPRIVSLFFSGFHYIPFFIALVYQMVRLLPANHPYANPANIGRFGIRHVIAEAGGNLVFDTRHLDQILLFVLILVGIVIFSLQLAFFTFYLIAQPAMAFQGITGGAPIAKMPTTFSGYFVTKNPEQDIAHVMLDMVFGVPDMFNSCVSKPGVPCRDFHGNTSLELSNMPWPWPAHEGLHAMLRMYSTGLLVVAVLITCYFIMTIILETAQTGTAFGKRFNKVWAPIRLVVAFGLLVPTGVGLNSAQYIVLHVAKLGSGFATNGWILFNETLDANDIYKRSTAANEKKTLVGGNLVSEPNVPEVGGLLQFLYVARTCAELVEKDPKFNKYREATYEDGAKKGQKKYASPLVRPYFVKDSLAMTSSQEVVSGQASTYNDMIKFIDGSKQVTLRFGILDSNNAADNKGNVDPVCGELNIPLSDPRKVHVNGDPKTAEMGAEVMQRYYTFVIKELWFSVLQGNPPDMEGIGKYRKNYPKAEAEYWSNTINLTPNAKIDLPPPEYRTDLQKFYGDDLRAALKDPTSSYLEPIVLSNIGAIEEMIKSKTWGMQDALLEKGWAGAGIWYNRIADLNGAVTAATLSIPTPIKYPKLMELVKEQKRQKNQNTDVNTMFDPTFNDKKPLAPNNYGDQQAATVLWKAFQFWQQGASTHTTEGSNAFVNVVNAIFGTDGLYSMRKNPDVHPLAQLVGLGRSLIEASIRNIGISTGVSLGVGVVTFLTGAPVPLIPSLISFIVSITIMTITMGFVLFYVLPFLPFIYFFFSVGGWVKAIFEAMIGMPLWALAHIRIDKDGLSGQAARNGYFLLFEIFLRPILIVFGLLASISIFAAIVSSLNQTWDLIVYNVGGFDVTSEISENGPSVVTFFRSSIDEFFYTVIYVILVYMMGMSSFKLIDLIPNNILRWMGESVQTFNDQREDAAEGLMGTASIGGQQAFNTVGGSLQKATGTISSLGARPK